MGGCVNNNSGGMPAPGLGSVGGGGHAGHGSSLYSSAQDFQSMLQPMPAGYGQQGYGQSGYGMGGYPQGYGQPPMYPQAYQPSYPPYNYAQAYGMPAYPQQAYGMPQPYGYSPYANGAARLGQVSPNSGSTLLSQAFAAGRIQADGPYTSQALEIANTMIESDPALKQAFYTALARGDTFSITSRDSGGPSFATIFPGTPDGQQRNHQLNFNISDYERAPGGAPEVIAHELWHTLGNVDHGNTHNQLIASTLSTYNGGYATAGYR